MNFFCTGSGRTFFHFILNSHNQNFGANQLWPPCSKLVAERKMQAILGEIKKSLCEFLGPNSQSIIIGSPRKTVNAADGGR